MDNIIWIIHHLSSLTLPHDLATPSPLPATLAPPPLSHAATTIDPSPPLPEVVTLAWAIY
jgi:hypothetical protein